MFDLTLVVFSFILSDIMENSHYVALSTSTWINTKLYFEFLILVLCNRNEHISFLTNVLYDVEE